ncbi:cytochrome P450 [Thozetella sp. PMI_491]|nr:cytochrome P450 [Thozetella sp. PMI_491]
MVSRILVLLGAAALWATYKIVSGLRANIAKAKATQLPYIVVPIHPHNGLWQLTSAIWVPLIKLLLPKSWYERWLFIMLPDWAYKSLQDPFERIGETFIVVAPGNMTMFTENADAIRQITARREAFPKDTTNYAILSLFGINVLGTEGALWRMHRKATSASFNEKNAAHTFAEAIKQSIGMLDHWFGGNNEGKTSTKTLTDLEHDMMTLALNIIGYVGFGLRLLWPGEALPDGINPKVAKYGTQKPAPGHSMSFSSALSSVLHRILALLLVPWKLLSILPFKWAKEAWEAKENYVTYMDEFLKEKIEEVEHETSPPDGMDIMGQLVRSKYGKTKDGAELSASDIIGNAFIITVAGHETTANTLHFTLVQLAINPALQRQLQKDVDALFGTTDPKTWNYEQNVGPMLASYLGASVNETLRLTPPVVEIPKVVNHAADQVLSIDGARHVLPAGLRISIEGVSVHRNPRYWPTKPSRLTDAPTDLDDFLPERWYRSSDNSKEADIEGADTEDYGGFSGPDTSASLFRPVRGSFVPFSDGARSCLGRRIALVEMIAALAVVFQKCSIELAVDEWATDDEVARMGPEEKLAVYLKAQEKGRQTIREATSILTLKLHGGKYVPVRYESLKKTELETTIDEYISENADQYSSDPKLQPYFASRARTAGSPVKKEAPELKVSKRRTKAADEIVAVEDEESSRGASTALTRTPGRALSLAARIPLPATPADVARAVDHSTVVVRERVVSLYQDSGITEATQATRETLSTVTSIIFTIAAFELFYLRPELIPNRYAFTIPSIAFLGTNDYPVHIPDMFVLLTSAFWNPALTWAFTSYIVPSLFGYFFNLSAASHPTGRRGRASQPEYVVDPLTFSIVKAVISYVVYAQGVTFGDWIDQVAVARINSALYAGWKSVIVGSAVSGLAAVYDAVLRK